MTTITKKSYTIDAAGQSLGRVASAAAKILMGKTSAAYVPHLAAEVKVIVINASKIAMREKKQIQKTYTHYTGYPGGLRKESFQHLAARAGHTEAIRRAVERMLPRNSLRTTRMKNITVTA
jgi:large subunit ribosomal protein L13